MASDGNGHNVLNSRLDRHRSRIMREMYHQSQNPFHEPPSSTGSHSTVTSSDGLGLSSTLSFDPDSQSTPRHEHDNLSLPRHRSAGRTGRFGASVKTVVNTSAIHKFFPDWAGQTARAKAAKDAGRDMDAIDADQSKENIPPASHARHKPAEFYERPAVQVNRARQTLQPTVENESDCSIVFQAGQTGSNRRSSRFTQGRPHKSPVAEEAVLRKLSSKSVEVKQPSHASPSTPEALKKTNGGSGGYARPTLTPGVDSSNYTHNPTALSFFLPSFDHINDLVSGTLRLSMKNGAPVFVKQGRVREQSDPNNRYADIEAIDLPDPEPAIFVSVDKIRDEVARLQEHDEMLRRECEELRAQLISLHEEVNLPKSRRRPDSAIGSESDQSMNERLNAQKNHFEHQIADLQLRLDEALRSIRVNELHINSLSAERDSALNQSSSASNTLLKLQADLDSVRAELSKLRREHDILLQEKTALQQDHIALEKQNEEFYVENKKLAAQTVQDQRRIRDLEQRVRQRDLMIQNLQSENTTRNTAFIIEEENMRLKEELELRDADIKKLKESYEEVNDRLHQRRLLDQTKRDNVYERVHEIKRDHKTQITELAEEHQTKVAEINREYKGRISELEQRLAEAEEELKNVSGKNDKLAKVVVERERDLINILRDINDNMDHVPDEVKDKGGKNLPADHRAQGRDGSPSRPVGILKKSATASREDFTGRYSVKSGMSLAIDDDNMTASSLDIFHNEELHKEMDLDNGRKRSNSAPNATAKETHAKTDTRQRRQSDTAEFEIPDSEDENMTSAFFLPDITVQSEDKTADLPPILPEDTRRVAFTNAIAQNEEQTQTQTKENGEGKPTGAKSTGPSLSKVARRVFENLCEHECRNCSVCAQISRHENHVNCTTTVTTTTVSSGAKDSKKKAIRVQRPVPVTERMPQGEYDEEPTMRPSQPPGQALALVIKQLEDEIQHLQIELNAKQARFNVSDKSLSRRERKALTTEIQEILRKLDSKSDQVYFLFDVLEGQKMAKQTMTQDEMDMTINSILHLH